MAFSFRNSRLVSVGLASVIAVGVIGAGSIAMADESDGGRPAQQGERHRPIKVGLHSLLKASGVAKEELREGAAAALTLGQIIDQYGDISADQAKANALAALDEALANAVLEGKLTQPRADKIEAAAPALLDRLLNAVPGEHKPRVDRPHKKLFAIAKHSLETVAGVLGTDVASIREQLAGGATIADIAGDQTQGVIDALVADANGAIDNAVNEGKLPAGKADEAKARAAAAIEKFVNEGHPKHDGLRKGQRGQAPTN